MDEIKTFSSVATDTRSVINSGLQYPGGKHDIFPLVFFLAVD